MNYTVNGLSEVSIHSINLLLDVHLAMQKDGKNGQVECCRPTSHESVIVIPAAKHIFGYPVSTCIATTDIIIG